MIALKEFTVASIRIFRIFGLKIANDTRDPKLGNKIFGLITVVFAWIGLTQAGIFAIINFNRKMFMTFAFTFSVTCFAYMSFVKIYLLAFKNRGVLVETVYELDELFPRSNQEQTKYKIKSYLNILKFQVWSYGSLMSLLYYLFNLASITISVVKFLFIDGSFERNLPYYL